MTTWHQKALCIWLSGRSYSSGQSLLQYSELIHRFTKWDNLFPVDVPCRWLLWGNSDYFKRNWHLVAESSFFPPFIVTRSWMSALLLAKFLYQKVCVGQNISKINITGINLHFYTFFNSFWKKRYINVIPCRENYIKKLQSLEIRNCHKSARKTNLQIRYIEIKIWILSLWINTAETHDLKLLK